MATKVWGKENSNSGQVSFLKWQKGVTTIRVVGNGNEHYVHWDKDKDDKPVKVICPGKNECPVCQKLNKEREEAVTFIEREDSKFFNGLENGKLGKVVISDRIKELKGTKGDKSKALIGTYEKLLSVYENSARKTTVAYVIDRNDGSVKIAELKNSIIEGIDTLAKYGDYGDPSGYDIKVTKSGEGMYNTKYTVMPGKQSPLTEDEQNMINELADLDELHKPNTKDEILAMGLNILNDSKATDEEIPV